MTALGSYIMTELDKKKRRYNNAAVAVTLELRFRRGKTARGPIILPILGA